MCIKPRAGQKHGQQVIPISKYRGQHENSGNIKLIKSSKLFSI